MSTNTRQLFDRLTKKSQLEKIYIEEIAGRGGTGMDGIDPSTFHEQKEDHFEVIERKCSDGSYTFTPYKQILKSRGRYRIPRVISIPTVRDRILLYVIKEVLHAVFDDKVNRNLPNQFVSRVKEEYKSKLGGEYRIYRGDIKNFYGSLKHKYLEKQIRDRISSSKVLKILFRAVKTPTVPEDYDKSRKDKYVLSEGIPQGLSVSNILAEIYLGSLDSKMKVKPVHYERYVDDILAICKKERAEDFREKLKHELEKRGNLCLNTKKSVLCNINEEFDFLGYKFSDDIISVRDASVQKYIDSIANLFTYYRENFEIEKRERFGLNDEEMKQVFLDYLNEKITGAISEDRRYGWIFYFAEINDETLLHRIDAIVSDLFERMPVFSDRPGRVKRVARAYWEAQYRPRDGYIRDYDQFDSVESKVQHLNKLGVLNPNEEYTPEQINLLFEKEKHRRLASLKKDTGTLS